MQKYTVGYRSEHITQKLLRIITFLVSLVGSCQVIQLYIQFMSEADKQKERSCVCKNSLNQQQEWIPTYLLFLQALQI